MKGPIGGANRDDPNTAHTPPGLVSSSAVDFRKHNEEYIKEVIEASRSILQLAKDGLKSDDGLKHAPVRTHLRILAGATFLLKVI